MRIGIVSYWFNRGQATVARQIRALFDGLGHETFVLARPTPDSFVRPGHVSTDDVWIQERVTAASSYEISEAEYLDWAAVNDIQVSFFDQNYQFDAVRRLRDAGVVTIGRFVWESFAPKHVEPAREAYSVIYSLTRCERDRYHGMGISSPYIPWGCPPDAFAYRDERENDGNDYLYIGGYLSNRKPTGAVVAAFRAVADPSLRLMMKTQWALKQSDLTIPASYEELLAARKAGTQSVESMPGDPRVRILNSDMSLDDYYRLFAASDVSLAPSRWEGLGLHLYEALALGVPTISCDIPPINEVITQGVDGILVKTRIIGQTGSGIAIHEPDLPDLRDAIEQMSQPGVAEELGAGARESSRARSWDRTGAAYAELLGTFASR